MARGLRNRALGLIGLGLLWLAGTLIEIGPLESDLTSRAAAALGARALDAPALWVAGRDVGIAGEVFTPSERQGAADAVAAVRGVRLVDAQLVWVKPWASAEPSAPALRPAPGAGADFFAYDFSFLWPWLLPAATLGAVVGWARDGGGEISARRGRGAAIGWGAALTGLAAGLVVAAMRWLPGRQGFELEAALLFLAAYIVGALAARPPGRLRGTR